MEEEFYLDPSKEMLFGYEYINCDLNIACLMEAVRKGIDLPAVDVVSNGEGGYELLYGFGKKKEDLTIEEHRRYGGHTRSLASYLMGVPLKANLCENHRKSLLDLCLYADRFWEIGDWQIVEFDDPRFDLLKLEYNLFELPEEIRGDFLKRELGKDLRRFTKKVSGRWSPLHVNYLECLS